MVTSSLKINGLTKQFKKFSLGPIDFQVEKGTAVALIGANGSGKSTLLRVIMNVLKADAGEIHIFDKSFAESETDIKQKIGYVGDLLEPFGHLTIKELASLISFWFPSWNHHQYEADLKRYNIDENMKYGKSSKGTKKKVEFIFSLCHDSDLLLLDEPTAGVDIVSQRKMREDLMNYMETGEKSIVLATHMVDEVKQICDYISIIEEGKIVQFFNKDEIYENWAKVWLSKVTDSLEQHPNVLTVDPNSNHIVTDNFPAIAKVINNEKINIIHLQRLSIEEVIENLVDTKKNIA